ncbi:hypothetical protein P7E02_17885 [Enterococcus hulanensis]|nr:hypothetical protein [Enterococcus hulanensis]MDT2661753.1 hypothetical protein [Enterococcus hulanensis]
MSINAENDELKKLDANEQGDAERKCEKFSLDGLLSIKNAAAIKAVEKVK